MMFGEIFRFELRYQLRQPIFWIGCAVFFLLTFLATTTDAVVIGGSSGQVHRNAAWVVMQMHLMMSMLGMFFVAAFVASSVVRDAQHHTEEIFYTLPIRKLDYLLGRFTGALVAAILAGVSVSLAMALGSLMPWLEAERIGPMAPAVYAFSLLALYAPNVILVSCVLFAVATPSRSLILTYGGVVGILVAYGVASALAADVSNSRLATLLDPLGLGAFGIATRYWTVLDKNVRVLSLDGPFLASRALWLARRARAARVHLLALLVHDLAPRAPARSPPRRARGLGGGGRAHRSPRRVVARGAARVHARDDRSPASTADAHGDHAGRAQPGVPGHGCVRDHERDRQLGGDRRAVRYAGLPGHAPDGLDSRKLFAVPARDRGLLRRRDGLSRARAGCGRRHRRHAGSRLGAVGLEAGRVRLDRGLDAGGVDPGRHRHPDLARLPPLRARALSARHAAGGGRRVRARRRARVLPPGGEQQPLPRLSADHPVLRRQLARWERSTSTTICTATARRPTRPTPT